jgi:hypothetical protein
LGLFLFTQKESNTVSRFVNGSVMKLTLRGLISHAETERERVGLRQALDAVDMLMDLGISAPDGDVSEAILEQAERKVHAYRSPFKEGDLPMCGKTGKLLLPESREQTHAWGVCVTCHSLAMEHQRNLIASFLLENDHEKAAKEVFKYLDLLADQDSRTEDKPDYSVTALRFKGIWYYPENKDIAEIYRKMLWERIRPYPDAPAPENLTKEQIQAIREGNGPKIPIGVPGLTLPHSFTEDDPESDDTK